MGLSYEEGRKITIRRFYNTFRCKKCRNHMDIVMAGNFCRKCFKKINARKPERERPPYTPEVLPTFLAKVARRLTGLVLPGDNPCVELPMEPHQDPQNIPVQVQLDNMLDAFNKLASDTAQLSVERFVKNMPSSMADFLKDLTVVLIEPITTYSPADMELFRKMLVNSGVNIIKPENPPVPRLPKVIILAELGPGTRLIPTDIKNLYEQFGGQVIDITHFVYALKTGVVLPLLSDIALGQTPTGGALLWTDPYKYTNPLAAMPFQTHGLLKFGV